jgi:hypothetical protein
MVSIDAAVEENPDLAARRGEIRPEVVRRCKQANGADCTTRLVEFAVTPDAMGSSMPVAERVRQILP